MRVRCPGCKGTIHVHATKMQRALAVHAETCPKPPEEHKTARGRRKELEMAA